MQIVQKMQYFCYNPFVALESDAAMAQFNALNTTEHKEASIAECHAIATGQRQSRVLEHFTKSLRMMNASGR